MSYSEADGFSSEAISFSGRVLSFDVSLGGTELAPAEPLIGDTYQVHPVGFWATEIATFIALRFENSDLAYRIRLSGLVKARNRAESPIYLIAGGEYYFPVQTDLGGEVVPGAPRIGVVAFEPFRSPAEQVDLHLSGFKLSATRGSKVSHVFRYSQDVASASEQVVARRRPGFVERTQLQAQQAADALLAESRGKTTQVQSELSRTLEAQTKEISGSINPASLAALIMILFPVLVLGFLMCGK